MNTRKLSDADLNQKIHELLGKCWHTGSWKRKRLSPDTARLHIFSVDDPKGDESCVHYDCDKCGENFSDLDTSITKTHPNYANSYDAIIPVVQGMDLGYGFDSIVDKFMDAILGKGHWDDYQGPAARHVLLCSPRQLAEAVYEVLLQGAGE